MCRTIGKKLKNEFHGKYKMSLCNQSCQGDLYLFFSVPMSVVKILFDQSRAIISENYLVLINFS